MLVYNMHICWVDSHSSTRNTTKINQIEEDMDAAGNTSTFEPSSDLIQEEDCNTLLVYLPGFTKELLKVQLTRTRTVKISGQRPLPNNRWSSFQKDFPVPENCDTNKITAKFEEGILYVRLPKQDKKLAPAETPQPQKPAEKPPPPAAKIDPPPPRPPTPMKTAKTTDEIKESSAPKDSPKKPVDQSREETRYGEKSSEAAEGGRKEKRTHTEETIGDRKREKGGGGSGRAEAEYKKLSAASPAARLKAARQQVMNIVVLLLVFGLGIYVGKLPWFSK